MKILFVTVPFRPSVGGIETVAALLAERFSREGHDVRLVTQTSAPGPDHETFAVYRRPRALDLLKLHAWADVVFHNNIGLRLAWPLTLVRRPWVVAHHTWIPKSGRGALLGRAKRWAIRHAKNVAVSRALAADLPIECTVIPNPFAADRFVRLDHVERTGDLIFLGRLVSDKGVPVLLEALKLLRERGRTARLTIVGGGADEQALREMSERLGLSGSVAFAGIQQGAELVTLLNRHRILVVPSTWEEPFGLVAIEALACGCVPIVSRSGGLPEAVGTSGMVVEKGNPGELAAAIDLLLRDPGALGRLRDGASGHVARHFPEPVAKQYLRVLETSLAH